VELESRYKIMQDGSIFKYELFRQKIMNTTSSYLV